MSVPITLPLSDAVLRSFYLGRVHNGGPAAAPALLQPPPPLGGSSSANNNDAHQQQQQQQQQRPAGPPGRINSLDFHRTNDLLVTASDDAVLAVYSCESGERVAAAGAGPAGCACVAWTHAPAAVVYASCPSSLSYAAGVGAAPFAPGGAQGNGGGGGGAFPQGPGGGGGGTPFGGGGGGAAGYQPHHHHPHHHPQQHMHQQQMQQQHDQHALRYHSLHDNRLVRTLPGHRDLVTCVAVSPRSDSVLSSSQDKTVRLWDLRAPQCTGLLQAPAHPTAAFDHQGLVFAVGADAGCVKLYDAGEYARGPFDAFAISDLRASPVPFSHLCFSADGKRLLAVAERTIYVLDAFTGGVVQRLSNGTPEAGMAPEACFTPDGLGVLSGCDDGSVRLWRVEDGAELLELRSHVGVPMCARFSPRRLMAATACHALSIWLGGCADDDEAGVVGAAAAAGVAAAVGGAAVAAPAAQQRPKIGSGAAARVQG
jgi:COMPASS component SWD2